MGFRTTFVSQNLYMYKKEWPAWIQHKYGFEMFEGDTISSNYERKVWPNYPQGEGGYQLWEDIQQALIEIGYFTQYKWDFVKTVRIMCHNEDHTMFLIKITEDDITRTYLSED